MWLAMDPPTADDAAGRRPQRARLLDPRRSGARSRRRQRRARTRRSRRQFGAGREFSRMRAEFTRSPGKLAIRDGVVWGPAIGATMEGQFDYARDDVRLRGTFVPAYRAQQLPRALADRRHVPRRRPERRRVRHDLRGRRSAGQRRSCASIRCRWSRPDSSARSSNSAAPTATGTCRRFAVTGSVAQPESKSLSGRTAIDSDPATPSACPDHVLHRLEQHVLLAAERQLDHAFRRQVLGVSTSSRR